MSDLKQQVVASRPSERTFSWEYRDAQQNLLRAVAISGVKTRKTGDFRQIFVDVQFPVPGDFPLILRRFYDSFDDQDRGLGVGWSLTPFELLLTNRVEAQSEGKTLHVYTAVVVREGSQQWIYQPYSHDQQGRTWYRREDHQQFLCEHTDHTFSLFLERGGVAMFNDKGMLMRVVDRQQIKTEYGYAEGRLVAIRHQNGKCIELFYQNDRLMESIDPKGTRLHYRYDEKRQLAAMARENGEQLSAYRYDSDLRLTQILGAHQEVVFEGGYDEYNRLSSVNIDQTTLRKEYSLADHSSLLTSEEGVAIQNQYDQNFRLRGQKTEGEQRWESVTEGDFRIERVFDNEGMKEWEYKYDARGLLIQATHATEATWEFDYDANRDLRLSRSPEGQMTYFQYDSARRLIWKQEHVKQLLRDSQKNIVRVTGPPEHLTQYAYHAMGRVKKVVAGGERRQFEYDENGILTELTLPSGYVMKRELDDQLRVKCIADKAGMLKQFEYDERGRLIAETSLSGRMEYRYTEKGRFAQVRDRCGNVTTFEYNPAGDLSTLVDAEGERFSNQ